MLCVCACVHVHAMETCEPFICIFLDMWLCIVLDVHISVWMCVFTCMPMFVGRLLVSVRMRLCLYVWLCFVACVCVCVCVSVCLYIQGGIHFGFCPQGI